MTSKVQAKEGQASSLAGFVKWHKKSSIAFLFTILVAVVAGVYVWSELARIQRDHDALASLALGDSEQWANRQLGEPRQSLDLCSEIQCESGSTHKPVLNVYRHEDYTVRAVFDLNKLEFYAVTQESEKYKPHFKKPYDLGELGDRSYKETMTIDTDPADVDMFTRSADASYAEVTPLGAANHYNGIVLAHASDGYSSEQAWDSGSAEVLQRSIASSKGPKERVAAADQFRRSSHPNTQGFFRDESYVGNLLHDASKARAIVSIGSGYE